MAAPVRSGENFETDAADSLFEFRSGTMNTTFAPCRNRRRAALSDQRRSGNGAQRAAHGSGQLDGGEAITPERRKQIEEIYDAAVQHIQAGTTVARMM